MIILIVISYLANKFSEMKYASPSFAFTFSFVPSLSFLLVYYYKWNAKLSITTMLAIIIGPIIFIFAATLTRHLINKTSCMESSNCSSINNDTEYNYIANISYFKLIFFLIFEIVTFLLLYRFVSATVGLSTFGEATYQYRQKSVESYTDIPSVISIMRLISISANYVWIYFLVVAKDNEAVSIGKKVIALINLFVGIFIGLLLGGRADIIRIIICIVFMHIAKSNIKYDISVKKMLMITLVMIVVLLGFQQLGRFVGRNLDYNILDYAAIYLSAPVKNLDSAIHEGGFHFFSGRAKSILDNQALSQILQYLSITYGVKRSTFSVHDVFPYRHINGYFLGNCYTGYYYYLFDGGWITYAIGITVMAIISEIVYMKAMMLFSDKRIHVITIIYALIYYYLLFHFFASLFYFEIFGLSFIRSVVILIVLVYVLQNIKFVIHGRRL